ncbi:siderophore-interacting protein [Xanthobacter sp. 126]|uniref:siderophore-interacting protein n=1 Tax=Xanthobacter sp. 126 TaxID=1131814 RepID=UPI00045E5C45|nr:siderophore-interacting protein [Xanthobacter sp. 126]
MLSARTTVAFPRIATFLPAILESLAAHDMPVTAREDTFVAVCPFGEALLTPGRESLAIQIRAASGPELNRVRHAVTGLVGFVAKSEALRIVWAGDAVGPTFPPDLRILTVRDVQAITPRMRRVIFEGQDLARFDTRAQIHTRLLFQPEDAVTPEWPMLDDAGLIVWPGGVQRLGSRVYTIRRVEPANGLLWIDFFDHGGNGPGARWLRRAVPGDVVGALGPAAHGPKPARRILLVGDETGLPGIARILEDAPDDMEGLALVIVADESERQLFRMPKGVEIQWLLRTSPAVNGAQTPLCAAVRALDWSIGHEDLFVWVGCEFHDFRAIRHFLRDETKLPASRIVAFSHWRRGMSEEDIIAIGGDAVAA